MTRDLVARIRSEANIADRPGQYDRLNQVADELAALRAQVEAMDSPLSDAGHRARWVQRADVLALFDGDTR